MGLAASLRHNLSQLARFSGRDPRATFWPYAAMIAALLYLGSILAFLSAFLSWWPDLQQFAAQHPESVTVQSGPGAYEVEMHGLPAASLPDMTTVLLPMVILSAGAILLLAAAVVRRLHDRNRSGWLGMLPLPFLAAGYLAMPLLFTHATPSMNIVFLLFASNALYLVALVYLVVQLASAGTAGDNRYGPDPLALRR